jgi:arsenate reductase
VSKPAKVLFVCIGNTCRSQIAEALARHHASDVIEPMSAGLSPFGKVVPSTRTVLLERGVSLDGQFSKGLREVDRDSADLIVNMTGMPGQSLFPGARVIDWDVDDPYGEDLLIYRQICDEIEERLAQLAADLRKRPSK